LDEQQKDPGDCQEAYLMLFLCRVKLEVFGKVVHSFIMNTPFGNDNRGVKPQKLQCNICSLSLLPGTELLKPVEFPDGKGFYS
jgi:hypothetical protein